MIKTDKDFVWCLDSFWVHADSTDVIGRSLRRSGVWEPEITRWMMSNVSKGSVCLDIGMNNGYFTELLARLSGSSGRVVSFEPRSDAVANYRLAQQRNNYNESASIEIHQVGLGNKNESMAIRVPKSNQGASTLLESFHYQLPINDLISIETVDVTRLESIIDIKADIVKIDIEGSEPQAFEGFGELVKQSDNIILEIHPSHPESFLSYLQDLYIVKKLDGQPVRLRRMSFGSVMNVLLRPR